MDNQYGNDADLCLIKTEEIYLGGVYEDVVCLPEDGIHINPNDDGLPDGPNCFVAGWGTMASGMSRKALFFARIGIGV